MIIRKAKLEDAEGILKIRNDENIRQYFRDSKTINLEHHINWLKKYLENKKNLFLIAMNEDNNKVIGYIRKDYIKQNQFEISIAIDINYQNQGIASRLLKELIKLSDNNDELFAEILNKNIKSINFFKKNDFSEYKKNKNSILLYYKKIDNILILTTKSWNIENFNKYKQDNWFLITDNKELTLENVEKINPKYIFIPHWSWIIKKEIWSNYTCIVFHMTDLPFGRGGSPLQNLIVRGIKETKISAIKIDGGIDTGDIYLKEPLKLDGTAEEIFKRGSNIVFEKMIPKILKNNITPKKQKGEIVLFKRRKEEDGELKKIFSIDKIYNYIRMLDGEGYPNAFIVFGDKKITFNNAKLLNGELLANVKITKNNSNNYLNNNVLIVVAHPDDEILGVGGTILKHIEDGDIVNILILSNGEDSRGKDISDNKKRLEQAKKVSNLLGVSKLIVENLPDNKFDSISLLEITQLVEKYIGEIKPNIIYTHHANDLNIDHRLTYQAVLTATRPQPGFFVEKIFTFETLSSTEWQNKTAENIFKPNYYVNIEKYIDKKLDIIKIYKDELRDFPHPRSLNGIEILSNFRGIEIGYKNAEAFEIIYMKN